MDTTSSEFRTELSRTLDRLGWGGRVRPLQSPVNNRLADYGLPNTARVSVPVAQYARTGLIWR